MKANRGKKLFDWQERAKLGGQCEKCHRQVSYLTVDHIIPVSILMRLDNGFELCTNWEENYWLLCQPCNQMKNIQLDITEPRTAKLLYELLKPYL